MEDQQEREPSNESITSLIREIRGVNPNSKNPRHRHFTNRDGHRTNNGYASSECLCGARKFPTAPRCPACTYEAGLISQGTMQNLLKALAGDGLPPSYGSTKCQCGRNKLPNTSHCKACAVKRGVLEISIEPGEEPCPNCEDGKKPAFTYCTGCATAEGYIDQRGQISPDCPMDDCKCGNVKYAAYTQCSLCAKGITGYRHQDWTSGPNPVRIFTPLPPATRADSSNHAQTVGRQTEDKPAATEPNSPGRESTSPCWRCDKPTSAAKRFCRNCLNEMGAPPEAHDSSFNDRSDHENRPPHMQGRG